MIPRPGASNWAIAKNEGVTKQRGRGMATGYKKGKDGWGLLPVGESEWAYKGGESGPQGKGNRFGVKKDEVRVQKRGGKGGFSRRKNKRNRT